VCRSSCPWGDARRRTDWGRESSRQRKEESEAILDQRSENTLTMNTRLCDVERGERKGFFKGGILSGRTRLTMLGNEKKKKVRWKEFIRRGRGTKK